MSGGGDIWTRRSTVVSNFPAGLTGSSCQIAPGGNWNLVYDHDIPEFAEFNVPTDVPYLVDNTALLAGTPYTRVGYAFELDGEFVWTEMDDFAGGNKSLLGVPADAIFEQPIGNLSILTNSPNVTEVTNVGTGTIEFWSNCYATGLNGRYDFDDDIDPTIDCYGSMQVHNGAQTSWAYNRWSNNNSGIDVGIGNNPVIEPDWTFQVNAGSFAHRRLLIYVK